MKVNRALLFGLVLVAGCGQPAPIQVDLRGYVTAAEHAALKAEVDRLKNDVPRWWRFVNDEHGQHSLLADGKVDLPAALKNAGQLVMNLGHSREEIVAFVQGHFSKIWDNRVKMLGPVANKIAKDHFLDDIKQDVEKLLTE